MEDEARITESCGCVYCDLGLKPNDDVGGRPVHTHRMDGEEVYMFCASPKALSPSESTKK